VIRLHDEIVAFAAWVEPTSAERRAQQEVVSRISKSVSGRFRDAMVTVFGSVAQGLALPDRCVPKSHVLSYANFRWDILVTVSRALYIDLALLSGLGFRVVCFTN
jgi:hypothetical protein